jgi:hypothetical protein
MRIVGVTTWSVPLHNWFVLTFPCGTFCIWMYIISWTDNRSEEKSGMFNEISGIVILAHIVCVENKTGQLSNSDVLICVGLMMTQLQRNVRPSQNYTCFGRPASAFHSTHFYWVRFSESVFEVGINIWYCELLMTGEKHVLHCPRVTVL